MPAVTSYNDNAPLRPTRPFAWSYSRLKNWRTCGRKHVLVDLLKRFPTDETAQLREGNAVHDAIAAYLKNGTPLPGTMRDFYPEIRRVVGNDPPGVTHLVEADICLRRDFVPCGPFEPGVWLRMKVDFAKVGRQAAVAVDWKTGAIKPDSEQLALMAQGLFSTYLQVDVVRTQYVWLNEHATTTEDFHRHKMPALWQGLLPEIERYEADYNSGNFPPSPLACVSAIAVLLPANFTARATVDDVVLAQTKET